MATLCFERGQIRCRRGGGKALCYSLRRKDKSYLRLCLAFHEQLIDIMPKEKRDSMTSKEMKERSIDLCPTIIELKKRGNIFKITGNELSDAYAKYIQPIFPGTTGYCLWHSRISDHFFAGIKTPKIISDEDGHYTPNFSASNYAKSNPKDLRTRKDVIQKQKIELLDLLENRYFDEFSVDGIRRTKPDSSLGQKLKTLRLNKNLTQKALSELTGIAKSTICDYESCRKNFGKKVAPKLATALGVDEYLWINKTS